jgi:hypothetical protein
MATTTPTKAGEAPLGVNAHCNAGSSWQQRRDTKHANAGRIGDADYRSKGAEDRRGLTPVVIVGGAVVGALDNHAVVGHGLTVAELGQRIAVRIEQGKVKIAGTGIVDALLVLKPELNLHQHAGFLLEGVPTVESDLQAVAPDVSDRRYPYKLERHDKPHITDCVFPLYNLRVNNP